MKIIIVGFFAFFAWSSVSTYIYVCKIRGFCSETMMMPFATDHSGDVAIIDNIQKPLIRETASAPKNQTIYFAFDKSEFNLDTATSKYCNESKSYLDQNTEARLNIAGFTDSIGTTDYNQALGYRGAQRMQQYFESKGILSNRITIESKGEKEPADDNNTEAGRAKNRRALLTIKN